MTSSTRAFANADNGPLLAVRDLTIRASKTTTLVENLSFTVNRGETVAIVGESGCGKSLTSLAVIQLLPANLAKGTTGEILFDGTDLAALPAGRKAALRGDRLSMIFQEPLTALNPVMTIGSQICEILRDHRGMGKAAARIRASELLSLVGIPDVANRIDDYPHQLSGGMRQRVVIAMAIACEPDLIIADEPTTALDVTVQAQILRLLAELQDRTGMAMIMITHDLGVVRQIADRMVVMYAGAMVEEGPVEAVLSAPRHPYTAGLIAARPSGSLRVTGKRLTDIPGMVPAADDRPKGCLFAPRCPKVAEACHGARPTVTRLGVRAHACFFPHPPAEGAAA